MASRKSKKKQLDYPFYDALRAFYIEEKTEIRKFYKPISKKLLDYNDKSKRPNAFLRKPQFEAFEIYVLIKELLKNKKVSEIFTDWHLHRNAFSSRAPYSVPKLGDFQEESYQATMFDDMTNEVYKALFDELKDFEQDYPNYIYALTMGTGKTILMATCIFYEFLLASKYPDDLCFCHNALVFAPDKTVLQSLREIKGFDMTKVIPPEYASFLSANIKFHYLDDTSTLNTIDGSDYNIIVSNTQKIILKEVHHEKTSIDKLLEPDFFEQANELTGGLYGDFDDFSSDREVQLNQRYQKIIRLHQLGVYVDEAHHLFGADLQSSLSDSSRETSLRYTINRISYALQAQGTKLVACYNYTGTPYVKNHILPEVVYAYGLKEAIDNEYLKKVTIHGFDNVKNEEFLRRILTDFFKTYGNNLYEGLKPKIAIFGASINEIINEIKPTVEGILNDLGLDRNMVLVNVGDSKDSDIHMFNDLDVVGSEGSQKQVILLDNKGREGWNCRSLFAVALFRSPKSKIFVLQATMRCLRSITEKQQTAQVYLSRENYQILDNELKQNFNIDIDIANHAGAKEKEEFSVHIVRPVETLRLPELIKQYVLVTRKRDRDDFHFNFKPEDEEKYKSTEIIKEGFDSRSFSEKKEFVSDENRNYSKLDIIFELSRYLNADPLRIKRILESDKDFDKVVELISKYNSILYAELVPQVFKYLYAIEEKDETKVKEIPLIKYPSGVDHFTFHAKKELTIGRNEALVKDYVGKSFHTDIYCFDSRPEEKLFLDFLKRDDIKKIYFTGMFTGAENGLSVQYIDPDSHMIRNYYPDFLVEYTDGRKEIIEVKGDNKIDTDEVKAKGDAMLESALYGENMDYRIIKSSDIMAGKYES